MSVRAWKVKAIGVTSLVLAERRSKAVAATFRGANDAGWDVAWTEIRATRWPEFDDLIGKLKTDHCWDPSLARSFARSAA